MGAELLHFGHTDMTKLIVAFRNFANPLKAVHFADTTYLCVSCVWNMDTDYVAISALTGWFLIYSLTMNLRVLCT